MKKIYIVPTLQVDEAEMVSMMAMSIELSNEEGSEEYVKEEADNGDWEIDW